MCLALDSMSKSVSELISLVKQLRDEVGQQRNEISYLRQLMENCVGCQPKPHHDRREQLRESCQANSPCYPGRMSSGPLLGHNVHIDPLLQQLLLLLDRRPVLRHVVRHQVWSLSTRLHWRWKALQARPVLF